MCPARLVRTVAAMPEPLDELALVALSDLAWDVVDPEGSYEAEEVAWVALLRSGWPPIARDQALRPWPRTLEEALAPRTRARVVAAVMAFLAGHPQRRDDAALQSDALRGEIAADVATWRYRTRAQSHRRIEPGRVRAGHDATSTAARPARRLLSNHDRP
jgi:hypothetical protein